MPTVLNRRVGSDSVHIEEVRSGRIRGHGCFAGRLFRRHQSGGDTTCKEFLTQDDNAQNDAVTKMLKDENQQEPSGLQTTAAKNSAMAYCKTLGNEKSKIKEAPHI